MFAETALYVKHMEARWSNYQKLKTRQGLNPGSPFKRQLSRFGQAPASARANEMVGSGWEGSEEKEGRLTS